MNGNTIAALVLIIAAVILVIWLMKKFRKPDITEMYQPINILTDREYGFYLKLRPVADEYDLQIFTKVRLADLIEPKPKSVNPMWMECFNKIKSKHIDFVLADYHTNIVALIELDDTTHSRRDRIERDEFVRCGNTV